ncbi:DHA2 family multidrug resistance protein-like MFS transporter [Dietzia sp. 2505]|uniref:MFS transporter n=1 Tax=Dietzia sp. 2505 TaxID=3156457 RepID=UPI003399F060
MSGHDTTPPTVTRSAHSDGATRASVRAWFGLVLLLLPMLALATDLTVLFFALPTLSADLQPTSTQALWIVHAYGFLIAGFLIFMGRLGDRVGPRRLLLSGAIAFAVLSAAAAFSGSAESLIVVRIALGVAGATLMPSLFSLLRVMFADDHQRRLAIAIMFSAFSVGGAVGPLLGGALLEHFWWGSVFLINVPPMLMLVALGCWLLPERRELISTRLDILSVALSVAGMLAVVFGLQELAAGSETGGSTWSHLGVVAAGAAVLWAFILRQRRHPNPLFDLALLADRRIAVSLTALLLVAIGVVGTFFLFTQHLQLVEGLSPLHAGVWTLPYIALNIAGAMAAPALAARWQRASVITSGLVVAATGAAALVVVIGVGGSLGWLVAAVSLSSLGQGVAMALISDLILSSAPEEQTGSAAAAQEVGGELGTALGIAAGGAIGLAVYRAALSGVPPAPGPAAALDEAAGSIHGGLRTAGDHPTLLEPVHDAISLGFQVYAGVTTVLVGAAATLVAAMLIRRDLATTDSSSSGGGHPGQYT